MKKESVLIIGRNALITTIIVILLNPASIYLGYLLSNRLRAPKLKIEYVEATPEIGSFKLSGELAKQLYHKSNVSDRFTAVMMSGFSKVLEKDEKKQEEAALSILTSISLQSQPTTIPYNLAKSIVPAVPLLIEYYNRNISIIEENIQKLNERISTESSTIKLYKFDDFDEDDMARLVKRAQEDKSAVIDYLDEYKKTMEYCINICENLQKELAQVLNSSRLPRTGNVTFNVGVLNYGDSDGVIFPTGELNFAGTSLVLKKLAEERFDVIGAHSFKNISFAIDLDKSTQGAVKKWDSLVTNYSQERYTIVIKTIRQDCKKTNYLPPD